jgi:hypothetical protein
VCAGRRLLLSSERSPTGSLGESSRAVAYDCSNTMLPVVRLYEEIMAAQAPVIADVLDALTKAHADFAVVGAHAVGVHARPRATIDFDVIVQGSKLASVSKMLRSSGYTVRDEGDVVQIWVGPKSTEAACDLMRSTAHPLWETILLKTSPGTVAGREVPIATRPALVALKFFSAVSPSRDREDRAQDVVDVARLVKTSWSLADRKEALSLVSVIHPGADGELARLLDDIAAGKPITI